MPAIAEPEPEVESVVEPESEPAVNVTAEPTVAAAVPEAEAAAEPVPEWDAAVPLWGDAWPFHIYGLGACFAALALISFCLLVLVARRRINSTRMVTPILTFTVVLGASRAIFLFGDAYGWQARYPPVFLQVMGGLAMPCMTSSYGLLLCTIVRALRPMHVLSGSGVLLKLAVFIALHFTVGILADIFIGLECSAARALVIFCHSVFIIWGLVLFCVFSWIGWTLLKQIKTGHRLTFKTEAASQRGLPWKRFRRPIVIIAMATVSGLGVMAQYMYGLTGIYHMYDGSSEFPRAWPWWSYQTAGRILEIVMSALIIYATVLTPDNQGIIKGAMKTSRRKLSRAKCSRESIAISVRRLSSTKSSVLLTSSQPAYIYTGKRLSLAEDSTTKMPSTSSTSSDSVSFDQQQQYSRVVMLSEHNPQPSPA